MANPFTMLFLQRESMEGTIQNISPSTNGSMNQRRITATSVIARCVITPKASSSWSRSSV
jgi:hypothetical protein